MGDVKAAISRIGRINSMETDINSSSISITTRIEEALIVENVAGLREVESASIKAQGINKCQCMTTNPSSSINFILSHSTSNMMSRLCLLLIILSNSRIMVVDIAGKVIDSSSINPTSSYLRTIITTRAAKTTSMMKTIVVISISNGEVVMDRAQ